MDQEQKPVPPADSNSAADTGNGILPTPVPALTTVVAAPPTATPSPQTETTEKQTSTTPTPSPPIATPSMPPLFNIERGEQSSPPPSPPPSQPSSPTTPTTLTSATSPPSSPQVTSSPTTPSSTATSSPSPTSNLATPPPPITSSPPSSPTTIASPSPTSPSPTSSSPPPTSPTTPSPTSSSPPSSPTTPPATKPPPPPKELTPDGYYWVIALAGFATIIITVIGTRHLQLLWGQAAYAQTAAAVTMLLAAAAGAAVGAKISPHLRRPLTAWTAVQILLALLTVYFHELFTVIRNWGFDFILPNIQSAATARLFKWGLGIAVFAVPAFLAGAAPALFAGNLVRLWHDTRARLIAACHTAAAAGMFVGMLFCYFLPEYIGLSAMMPAAGMVTFFGVIGVWVWSHRYDDVGAPITAAGSGNRADSVRHESLLTLIAFVTGLALLIYVTVWQRALALLSVSAQSVADIGTATVLLGLALGAWCMLPHRREALPALAWVKSVAGVIALSLVFVFILFERALAAVLAELPRDALGFIAYTASLWGIAAVLILPAAVLVGMSLPLLARAATDQIGEAGSGRALAAVLAGAALGGVLAPHILLPNADLKYTLLTGALLDMAMGIVLLGFIGNRAAAANNFVAAAGLLVTAVLFGAADIRHRFDRDAVVLYRDSADATVLVSEAENARALFVNGRLRTVVSAGADTHTPTETADVLSALLPLLYKPDAERILNIGLGNPLTARTLLTSGNLRQLDTAEASPALAAALPLLLAGTDAAAVFSDPRHRILADDVQALLPQQTAVYDIIISQPHFRWQPVAAQQLTEEFYAAAAAALKPDGIFAQRLSLADADGHLLATALNALARSFEQFNLYTGDNADLIIIAGKQSELPPTLNAIFAFDDARQFLSQHYFYSAADADILFLGDGKRLRPYFEWYSTLANSAQFPAAADDALSARYRQARLPLEQVAHLPVPLAEMSGGRAVDIRSVRASPQSPLRQKAQQAREIYEQRYSDDGDIGQLLAALPAEACPADTADDESASDDTTDNSDATSDDDTVTVVTNAEVLANINRLINRLLPHTGKNQMADIWRILESNDCIAKLLTQDYTVAAHYLRFWRALSLRDADGIIRTTTVLLPHTHITGASANLFTLAKMAAHYQQGDFEAMLETQELYPLTHPAHFHAAQFLTTQLAL